MWNSEIQFTHFSAIREDNKSMSHTTDFFNRNHTDDNRTVPRTYQHTNDHHNLSVNNIHLNNRFELLNCHTNESIMSLENEVPQTRSHENIQSYSREKGGKSSLNNQLS